MAVVELRGRVMASELHIIAHDPGTGQLEAAHALLERLERRWSRFLTTSDLSRVNAGAGTPVVVSPWTLALVDAMQVAWGVTRGRYDPTVLPVLVANGYGASKEDPARRTVLTPGPHRADAMGEVHVDHPTSTVMLPAGVALDPGGIGKGLAADAAVAQLLEGGASGALVAIGGDLAMGGRPPDPLGWPINVEGADPEDGPLCQVMVERGGVATSSTRSRTWTQAGRTHHHLIDPARGAEASTDLVAATVFAASGWQAEVHATGALLASSRSVLDYLDQHGLVGLAITGHGDVLHTPELDGLHLLSPAVHR